MESGSRPKGSCCLVQCVVGKKMQRRWEGWKVSLTSEDMVGSRPVGAKVPQHSQHSAHANPLPTFGLRVGHLLVLLPS